MKPLTVRLVLFAALVFPVHADFQAGLDAFNRGDTQTALNEWQPLAEKGDANAQYNLGLIYARGQGVPQDYRRAAEWYEKAAAQDVAAAQYNLAVLYANGQGIPQNLPEARKWLEKAAAHDVPEAEDGLGYFYGEGQGMPKNYGEAAKWYRKAAEAGVPTALYNLGVMYDLGQGTERNYDEAMNWYRKAADGGSAAALCNIGILYYNGQGVERDMVEAHAWFSRCEQAGDPRGGQLRRAVESGIKPDQLRKAQQLAAGWHPAAPPQRKDLGRLFAKLEPKTESATAEATTGEKRTAAAPAPPAPESVGGADRTVPAAPPAEKPTVSLTPSPSSQSTWTGVNRIVAVGDVFGDFEQFFTVLESANLVDGNGDWVGGAAHLVQTGNVVDFGPDSRRVMELLMRLEKQAAAAGGAVHCLIGNHEAMDVSGGAMQALEAADAQSGPVASAGGRDEIPLAGTYGRWIATHNTVIKIDRTLFVHAGLGPKYAGWELDRINDAVRAEVSRKPANSGVLADADGPLLYTALAKGDETALAPLVEKLLAAYGVERIVLGHTYAGAAVMPRFGGKVILVNVGLSRVFDRAGRLACLLIEGDRAYAVHRGQKLELPRDEGAGMLRYLREAAALDPRPSPLQAQIDKLMKIQAQR